MTVSKKTTHHITPFKAVFYSVALAIIVYMLYLAYFWFSLVFVVHDPIDKQAAADLPRYPNSSTWDVSLSSGFPGGREHAVIAFTTADTDRQIIDYYATLLSISGWTQRGRDSFTGTSGTELFYKKQDGYEITLDFSRWEKAPRQVYINVYHTP